MSGKKKKKSNSSHFHPFFRLVDIPAMLGYASEENKLKTVCEKIFLWKQLSLAECCVVQKEFQVEKLSFYDDLVNSFFVFLHLDVLPLPRVLGFSKSARTGRTIFQVSSPVTVNSGLGNVTQITKIDLAEVVSPSRENEMKCESQLRRQFSSTKL